MTLSPYLSMSQRPCSAVQRPFSSLTPLPTTIMEGLPAGLDYLQYPHTEAFGIPSLACECPLQGRFLSFSSRILPLQPPEMSAPFFIYFLSLS